MENTKLTLTNELKNNYNFKKSLNSEFKGPKGGDAVIILKPEVWTWGGLNKNSIGIISGNVNHEFQPGQSLQITFNYSAYKDGYCKCSGGPGTISTPFECLIFSGYEIEINYWRFKNGLRRAHNSEYYKEFVPLYIWNKSENDVLVKEEKISKKEFNEALNSEFKINLINNDYNDWVRNEKGLAEYMPEVTKIFALNKDIEKYHSYLILPVYFKIYYWYWNNSGKEKYKKSEYFKQYRKILNLNYKSIENVQDNEIYVSNKYYKH